MALPSSAIIEIRSTATANNVNGGGFNSARGGTDYSQQNAAQLTGTDLTCTAASTTITSATGGFTSVMVGNYIHLTALTGTGAIVGWYEIVTFTDTNNVILDRTPTNGVNNITAGTFYVGGALSLASTLDDDSFEAFVAGNTGYVKGSATYVLGEAVSITSAGSTTSPIKLIGYDVTRGDNPTGSNRPTFSLGANQFLTGSYWWISNIIFTGTGSNVLNAGAENVVVNCKAVNLSTTADRVAMVTGGDVMIFNSEGRSIKGRALNAGGRGSAIGCWFHDSDIGIIDTANAAFYIFNNLITSNMTAAIRYTVADLNIQIIQNNTLYGSENTTGIGIDTILTGIVNLRVINNIIYGFATGVNFIDTSTEGFDDYNDYFNNDNNVNNVANWQVGDHNVAIAPTFSSVGQVTGTTGKYAAGGGVLIDTSKDFTTLGVVANRDSVYLVSGTGVTTGVLLITGISTTTNPNDTLTLEINPGTNTTADKVYQITTGQNFAISGAI